jgi:hypothetical protein
MKRYIEIEKPKEDPIKRIQGSIDDSNNRIQQIQYKIGREKEKDSPNDEILGKLIDGLKLAQNQLKIKKKELEVVRMKQQVKRDKEK